MKNVLLSLAACAITSAAFAQPTVNVLLHTDDTVDTSYNTFLGDTDSDPSGLALLPSGKLVYFEDEGGGTIEDSLILFDDAAGATFADKVSVIIDEPTLLSYNTFTTGTVITDVGVVATEDGDLIAGFYEFNEESYFIVRGNNDGSDSFTWETIVDASALPNGVDSIYINKKTDPDTIIVSIDDTVSANDSVHNGIFSFPADRAAANSSDPLTSVASFTQLGALTTPATNVGTEFFGVGGVYALSADEYIFYNAYGEAGTTDGEFLYWNDTTDTGNVFIENDTYATGAPVVMVDSGIPGTFALLICSATVAPYTDDILLLDSTDGSVVRTIATQAEILSYPGASTVGVFFTNWAADSNGAGTYYIFTSNNDEALLEIIDNTSVADWNLLD